MVELVHAAAEAGETEWASILAIRALAATRNARSSDAEDAAVCSDLWNDLGALRFAKSDTRTAVACLHEALRLDPGSELAAANLADIEPLVSDDGASVDADLVTGPANASPWVAEALRVAEQTVGLAGRRVLEVGGALPRELALASGAASWTACDPSVDVPITESFYSVTQSDVRSLPFPDRHFDVVFSSCAFEHIHDFDRALGEMSRVLCGGGQVFTQFAPIWSCAIGHHLFLEDTGRGRLTFNDPLLPHWAHLLLEPHELDFFLRVALGAEDARRVVEFIFEDPYLNRLFQSDFERCFEQSGLERTVDEPWGTRAPLTPALARELGRRHPAGGSFAIPGYRVVLVKPGS